MSRLVMNVGIMARLSTGSPAEFPCRFEDELRYSGRLGQTILLVGRLAPATPAEYFANATLAGFVSTATGVTLAQLTEIQHLPHPAEAPDMPNVFGEIDAADLQHLMASTPAGREVDEYGHAFAVLDVYGAIGQQLAQRQNHICSFSGVRVSIGMGTATPIRTRTRTEGGTIHVQNCLFLHDEPAMLFSQLAWTVGRDFEIIADSWTVGAAVLSTINPSGRLALGDDPAWWPDQEALSWHRGQFYQRLK